jgi:hypothetical protein
MAVATQTMIIILPVLVSLFKHIKHVRVMKLACCTIYLQFIESLYLYMFQAC